jgi:hypothetical protein
MRSLTLAAGTGAACGLVALGMWGLLIATTPHDPMAVEDARTPRREGIDWTPEGARLHIDWCSHCPRFVLAGRGIGTGHERPDGRAWIASNWPALVVASNPAGRRGTGEVRPALFAVAVTAQWAAIGAVAVLLLRARLRAVERRDAARAPTVAPPRAPRSSPPRCPSG